MNFDPFGIWEVSPAITLTDIVPVCTIEWFLLMQVTYFIPPSEQAKYLYMVGRSGTVLTTTVDT